MVRRTVTKEVSISFDISIDDLRSFLKVPHSTQLKDVSFTPQGVRVIFESTSETREENN